MSEDNSIRQQNKTQILKKLERQKKKILLALLIASVMFIVGCVWYVIDLHVKTCSLKGMPCAAMGSIPLRILIWHALTAMIIFTVVLVQNRHESKTGRVLATKRKILDYVLLTIFVHFIVSPLLIALTISVLSGLARA